MSANPHRGEIDIEFRDGTVHTLRFDMNSWARLEENIGQSLGMSVFEALQKGSLLAIRNAVWIGIRSKRLSANDVGKLMDPHRLSYYTDRLMAAFEAAGFLGSDSDEDASGEAPGEPEEDG